MKFASVKDVKAKFGAYVKASEAGPVLITRKGKAVAALIPLERREDVERLMLGCSPQLRKMLSRARERVRSGRSITHEQFWRETRAR